MGGGPDDRQKRKKTTLLRAGEEKRRKGMERGSRVGMLRKNYRLIILKREGKTIGAQRGGGEKIPQEGAQTSERAADGNSKFVVKGAVTKGSLTASPLPKGKSR